MEGWVLSSNLKMDGSPNSLKFAKNRPEEGDDLLTCIPRILYINRVLATACERYNLIIKSSCLFCLF